MKKVILLLVTVLSISAVNAQKVKLKKGIVSIDKEECLKYDSEDSNNFVLMNMDESQTIFLKYIRTGVGANGGLYTKIIFSEQEKSLTSKSYIFTKKMLINKLLSSGVISECEFDESKIDKFIQRYDEKIESNLIRH
jgi:hypothetical protein